jgi:hypothetical protein
LNRRPEEALKLCNIDQNIEVCVWGECWVNEWTDTLGIISKDAEMSKAWRDPKANTEVKRA